MGCGESGVEGLAEESAARITPSAPSENLPADMAAR
jgi:hypothetical protein